MRVFAGQEPSCVWVGWVTPDYHQHDMSFDLSKVRAVTVTMGDEQGNVHSRCWVRVGVLCAGGRLAWAESGSSSHQLWSCLAGVPGNLREQKKSWHPLQKFFFLFLCSLIISLFYFLSFKIDTFYLFIILSTLVFCLLNCLCESVRSWSYGLF